MDTSKTRMSLQGVAKIFEAGLKSKTWDIHRMPELFGTINTGSQVLFQNPLLAN